MPSSSAASKVRPLKTKKKLKLGKSVPVREAWQQEDKAYFKTKQRQGEGSSAVILSTAPEPRPMPLFLADDDSIGDNSAHPALIEPLIARGTSSAPRPSDTPPTSEEQSSSNIVPMNVSSETPQVSIGADCSTTGGGKSEKYAPVFLAMQLGSETGSHLVLNFEVSESETERLEKWKHREKLLE